MTEEQLAKVHEALLQLEVERGERIKQKAPENGEIQAPTAKRTRGPKYLRDRRLGDEKQETISATEGDAQGDFQ